MATVVPAFVESATSGTSHQFTAPSGIAGMQGLIAIGTGLSTAVVITASSPGATFTKLDEQGAGNCRATLFRVTGLTSGATVALTLSGGSNTVGIAQFYTDEHTLPSSVPTAGIRSSSQATTTTGAYTPAAGQRLLVVGVERTTAATTVSSVVSTGGESVTTERYGEGSTIQTSVLIARFDAADATSHTVTITYSNSSANGYAVLVPLTAVSGGGGGDGGASSGPPVVRSSTAQGASSGTTSTTVPAPDIEVGDYLLGIQFANADNDLDAMNAPSGFGALISVGPSVPTENSPCIKLHGKIANSSDAAAINFTFTDGLSSEATATGSDAGVVMVVIQAGTYNAATPVVTPVATFTETPRTSTTLQTAPPVTASMDQLCLAIFAADINNRPSSAPFQEYPTSGPSGMTRVQTMRGGGNYVIGGVYRVAITTAGETGTRTVTPSNASTQNGWAAGQILINPNPTGDSPTKFFLAA